MIATAINIPDEITISKSRLIEFCNRFLPIDFIANIFRHAKLNISACKKFNRTQIKNVSFYFIRLR